jgi:hypothetical protein
MHDWLLIRSGPRSTATPNGCCLLAEGCSLPQSTLDVGGLTEETLHGTPGGERHCCRDHTSDHADDIACAKDVAGSLMMVIGAHRINQGRVDIAVCESIHRMVALIPGSRTLMGTGVYAFYVDHVPRDSRFDPFVIFAPLPQRGRIEMVELSSPGFITPGGTSVPDRRFFLLPGEVGKPIKVAVLGFVNGPPMLPKYPGILYYV